MEILNEEFYTRNTIDVSKDLLGKFLIHEIDGKYIGGKIVETEAYTGVLDKAAHVYGGRKTPRVMPMYNKGGTAYIYSIYGMYYCLNSITEKEGEPQGVLIRGIEPLLGLDYIAKKRYKKKYETLTKKEMLNLTSGPSKLCIALDIDKRLNNKPLYDNELFIANRDKDIVNLLEKEEDKTGKIIASKRIGIDYAEEARDYLYRFYYKDNSYVSKKDRLSK